MPMNPKDYPPNWKAIALEVKEAANWTCENCHRPCRRQGESKREFRNRIAVWHQIEFDHKPQRFTLTVAHLNHTPMDCDRSNLKAWCSVCHCLYDIRQMNLKKYLKRERNGQLSLFSEEAQDNNKHQAQKRKQLTIFDILGE